MKLRNGVFPAALFALAAVGGVLLLISPAVVQGNSGVRNFGIPHDWTHHHVVFSHPGSFADAVGSGSLANWHRLVTDPRYVIQQRKRALGLAGIEGERLGSESSVSKDWSMTLGSGGRLAAGQYPAKYTFSTGATLNCANAPSPDYVVYPTGLAGSGTQATVVAFFNLYSGTCTGTVPSTYWAYNTGGTATTSPVLSLDGSQVAFIQTSGGVASLVILRWANSGGTVGAPTATTGYLPVSYNGCPAPCYTALTLNGSPNDTNSPPFYVYRTDTMYVGDNSGKLHQFTGVFLGTPAETMTNGWPVTLSANVLTGTVYDPVSTLLFVGDSGGFLYSVTTSGATRTVVTSGQLAATGSTGIVDAPLLDSTPATPLVYAFVGDDGGTEACAGGVIGVCGAVYQFATNFAANSTGVKEKLGRGSLAAKVYAGSFDNTHYIGSGSTGKLYVCGTRSAGADPRLFQIVMNGTFTGAVNTFNTPTSAAATCSPVTEFLGASFVTTLGATITAAQTSFTVTSATGISATSPNNYIQIDSEIMLVTAVAANTLTVTRGQLGTTAATHNSGARVTDIQDWIFLSVTATGSATGCTGACLYNFLVTNAGTTGTATTGLVATGGTSGIIVDNASTLGGGSQIYFSTLTSAPTTLSAAMTAVQTTASVHSGTAIVNNDYIQINSEILQVTAGGGTTTLTVTRGQLGTTAAAHTNGSTVTDFGICGTSGGAGGCAVQASQSAP